MGRAERWSYNIVLGFLHWQRLYRLYACDTRRYEVVQVVGGEYGAHDERVAQRWRSGGGNGSDYKQGSEEEAPTHKVQGNCPDIGRFKVKKHFEDGLQKEAMLQVVEHSPIVGSHFSAENQWALPRGRSDAAAQLTCSLARPPCKLYLTLALPQHSSINLLQAAYCASFSLAI
jgi:hypothetical protein